MVNQQEFFFFSFKSSDIVRRPQNLKKISHLVTSKQIFKNFCGILRLSELLTKLYLSLDCKPFQAS